MKLEEQEGYHKKLAGPQKQAALGTVFPKERALQKEMPEIYVSTSCLRGTRDLQDILQAYSTHGIEKMELSSGLIYIEYPTAVLERYSRLKFVIHNYFPPARVPFIMNLAAQDDGVRMRSVEICKRAMELCHRFGFGIYSFHPGFRLEGTLELGFQLSSSRVMPYARSFQAFCRSVEEILEASRRLGVKVALENLEHKNQAYMMTRPEEFARFQEIFPEVGVLLDLGHLKIASARLGFDVNDFLKVVQDNVLEVHIHENDGARDLHLEPLGGAMMRYLKRVDCEIVVLECRDLNVERISLNLRALEYACS